MSSSKNQEIRSAAAAMRKELHSIPHQHREDVRLLIEHAEGTISDYGSNLITTPEGEVFKLKFEEGGLVFVAASDGVIEILPRAQNMFAFRVAAW